MRNNVFFHKKNKSIEYYPDMDEVMGDMESWQVIMRKIEEDFDNYVKASKMDSIQSFRNGEIHGSNRFNLI